MKSETKTSKSIIAKSDDGSVQITFTIPWKEIEIAKNKVLEVLGKEIEIPGFRKGMAPVLKVEEKVGKTVVIEKTLSEILPKLLGEAIAENKLKIAIYPKFELLSAKDEEDWQIRAITCEIPEFDLGNYKEEIKAAFSADSIWTPNKGEGNEKKEISVAEKEQKIIDLLIKSIKVNIPKVLIDEEVNTRLSRLLERIEKLGLSLENYLASIGKNPELLRKEYEESARNAISAELILNKISQIEGIKIEEKEINDAIKAGSASEDLQEKLNTPEQRSIIESILRRRHALDFLVSLA
jgi:FKBP-type peptidyl-prolyl cis-trans isomerase (trigger factor)